MTNVHSHIPSSYSPSHTKHLLTRTHQPITQAHTPSTYLHSHTNQLLKLTNQALSHPHTPNTYSNLQNQALTRTHTISTYSHSHTKHLVALTHQALTLTLQVFVHFRPLVKENNESQNSCLKNVRSRRASRDHKQRHKN
jgi:hypothetical protein